MKIPPLAERLRPKSLFEIVGQDHLLGDEGFLTKIVANAYPISLLLWGPPGCGKTTLAKLYAQALNLRLICISAMFSGTTEIKKIIQDIENQPLFHVQTVLFVDEIHRLNKAQQDIFLPSLETGSLIFIGATTENPSFVLNNALLSRLRVLNLKQLDSQSLNKIIDRCEEKLPYFRLTAPARQLLVEFAQGDARHLLNSIENLSASCQNQSPIDLPHLEKFLQRRSALYDKEGDGHYNLISALHKSIRGSDPDASLYWLARMIEAGEDPQYLSRRLVRMAIEDIGLADPDALTVAHNAWKSYDRLGKPEGELALAQAVVYLALAPKSNSIYTAFQKAQELSKRTAHLSPPKTILNAPTSLMKELGYSKGYQYDHDTELGFSGQNYFPEELEREVFYFPKEYGFEREMKKRIEYFNQLKIKKNLPS